MLSSQEEQAERERVLENDRRVREQQKVGTLLDHAKAQGLDIAGGRYGAAMGAPTVTGSKPIVQYPAASGPWQGPDPVGDEPALGFAIDRMPEVELGSGSAPPDSAQVTGPASADAPSLLDPAPLGDAQRVDAGLSSRKERDQ